MGLIIKFKEDRTKKVKNLLIFALNTIENKKIKENENVVKKTKTTKSK